MDLRTLPFSMKPVGWFQIGWSAEIPASGVKPIRHFGQDLVAYRTEAGELVVLDAHCKHLGAHLGYGGQVKGDCIACPYHGWEWGVDGANVRIPNQDQPARVRLKSWTVREQHECVFLWHDPTGAPPRWPLPHVFESFEDDHLPTEYYPAYGNSAVRYSGEAVHPQITMENGVDSSHFRYTHGAPTDPQLLGFQVKDAEFHSQFGFVSPKTSQIALHLDAKVHGVGLAFNVFSGNYHYRVLFACTPVDDETSDLYYSIWYPRAEGDTAAEMPEAIKRHVADNFLKTIEEDFLIWRNQVYVSRPIIAKVDLEAYSALRRWQRGFYDLPHPDSEAAPLAVGA